MKMLFGKREKHVDPFKTQEKPLFQDWSNWVDRRIKQGLRKTYIARGNDTSIAPFVQGLPYALTATTSDYEQWFTEIYDKNDGLLDIYNTEFWPWSDVEEYFPCPGMERWTKS